MNINSFVLRLLHNQSLSFVVRCILVASSTQLLWHMHSVWNSTSCAFDWQFQEVCILNTIFLFRRLSDPIGVCIQWPKPRMVVGSEHIEQTEVNKQKFQLRAADYIKSRALITYVQQLWRHAFKHTIWHTVTAHCTESKIGLRGGISASNAMGHFFGPPFTHINK